MWSFVIKKFDARNLQRKASYVKNFYLGAVRAVGLFVMGIEGDRQGECLVGKQSAEPSIILFC
jgi:hypothetical protein